MLKAIIVTNLGYLYNLVMIIQWPRIRCRNSVQGLVALDTINVGSTKEPMGKMNFYQRTSENT